MTPYEYPEGCFFETLESIHGKRVTVMGLGLNGGGLAAARFFLRHGAHVTVTDMKNAEQLSASVSELENDDSFDHALLTFRLGLHEISDFENADCIIKNPGVKFAGNKFLAAATEKKIAIETDLSVFLHFCRSSVIAVTGSKGKSSTVSAIYHGLSECGFTAFLGGNITVSPLTFLEQTNENTPVVLELSSWQLADLRGRKCLKPKISVITKIVPDHLNWYGNMTDYVADKKLIYKDQDENDFAVFDFSDWNTSSTSIDYDKSTLKNAETSTDDDAFAPPDGAHSWGEVFAKETLACVVRPDEMQIKLPRLQVPGAHNKINALNAAAVLCLMGIEKERAEKALETWQGIPHRLQYFHTWQRGIAGGTNNRNESTATISTCATSTNASNARAATDADVCATDVNASDIRFYNDSAATVPEAAAAAIDAFDEKIIFITGGTDKGLAMEMLAAAIVRATESGHIARLYLLAGSGTDKLVSLLDEKHALQAHTPNEQQAPYSARQQRAPHAPIFDSVQSLLKAVRKDEATCPSDASVAVFSPGATSFGMFQNEFDRGNKFMKAVKEIF